jgi:serine/threonine protein kinase
MKWHSKERTFTPYHGKDQFTEKEIQKLMRDMIRGLDYRKYPQFIIVHVNGVVHRDIKP